NSQATIAIKSDHVTQQSVVDLANVYSMLENEATTSATVPAFTPGATITSGVYSQAAAITTSGSITLDGEGDSNSIFIFRTDGALTIAASTQFQLINGATSNNIFFVADGAISLGANSVAFGTFISIAAITVGDDATLEGRVLSTDGVVTNGGDVYMPTLESQFDLGYLNSFALFTGLGALSNTGANNIIVGDVGSNSGSITGFENADLTGNIQTSNSIINNIGTANITSAGSSITEEAIEAGDVVATFTASGLDNADNVTFLITSGNDDSYFIIDANTGVVTLTAAGITAINSDVGVDLASLPIGVTATDGTNSSPESIANVGITRVNDNIPTINISDGSTVIAGSVTIGDLVATFTALDLDEDTITFSITSGNGSGHFAIDVNTGNLTLTEDGVTTINSDDGVDLSNLNLGITANDGLNNSTEYNVTVNIDRIVDNGNVTVTITTTEVAPTLAPVVLDLDGDGVEYANLDESKVMFDADNDGVAEHVAWAGKDDGILVYDIDSDNDITKTDEVSFLSYKDGAQTDLEGLQGFDTNQDMKLSQDDVEWSSFKVWQDGDLDGDVDEGELYTLDDLGIVEFNLTSDHNKNVIGDIIEHGKSSYTTTQGDQYDISDTSFAYEEINSLVDLSGLVEDNSNEVLIEDILEYYQSSPYLESGDKNESTGDNVSTGGVPYSSIISSSGYEIETLVVNCENSNF
ncbi:MAG: hypothetical protein ACI9W5_000440, partial [Ulvibacter sp.]